MQFTIKNTQIYRSIKNSLFFLLERLYFEKEDICERVDSIHFMKRYFDGVLCENTHYEIKTNGRNR